MNIRHGKTFNFWKEKKKYGRTEADDVVVPRTAVYDISHPRVILNPPDESLWAALDLTDILLARDYATRELIPRHRVWVQHNLDAAQPVHELLLNAAHERLRACARATEHLAHAAHGKAELPRVARFGIRRRGNSGRERSTAREVRWEWDGERCVWDREGRLEVTL
jgi:hypothetical protein